MPARRPVHIPGKSQPRQGPSHARITLPLSTLLLARHFFLAISLWRKRTRPQRALAPKSP